MHPDAADLAPGDAWAARLDWQDIAVHRVRSPADQRFARGYEALWGQFGAADEMERRDVIVSRFAWDPRHPVGGCALLYEMLVLERAGMMVAVRDHTAIVALDAPDAPAVVHLSHALVLPSERGTGLGAWLRALPLAAARECVAQAGGGARPITLVAEMEPLDPAVAERVARLRTYGRAGFRCVDPELARYRQPDFRSPQAIDASALAPLALVLLVRRVGLEDQDAMPRSELRNLVRALYTMYAVHQRERDMAPLWALLDTLPAEGERARLLPCAP